MLLCCFPLILLNIIFCLFILFYCLMSSSVAFTFGHALGTKMEQCHPSEGPRSFLAQASRSHRLQVSSRSDVSAVNVRSLEPGRKDCSNDTWQWHPTCIPHPWKSAFVHRNKLLNHDSWRPVRNIV